MTRKVKALVVSFDDGTQEVLSASDKEAFAEMGADALEAAYAVSYETLAFLTGVGSQPPCNSSYRGMALSAILHKATMQGLTVYEYRMARHVERLK